MALGIVRASVYRVLEAGSVQGFLAGASRSLQPIFA